MHRVGSVEWQLENMRAERDALLLEANGRYLSLLYASKFVADIHVILYGGAPPERESVSKAVVEELVQGVLNLKKVALAAEPTVLQAKCTCEGAPGSYRLCPVHNSQDGQRLSTPSHRPVMANCPDCKRIHPECGKARSAKCYYDKDASTKHVHKWLPAHDCGDPTCKTRGHIVCAIEGCNELHNP
jgi:hypothetical protein